MLAFTPTPPLQSHLITLVARHAQLFWGSWLPLPQPSQKWANSSTLYLYRLLQREASPGLIKSNPPSYRWASPCLPLQWAEFCQALDGRVLSFGDGDRSFGFRKTAASSIKWNEVLMPFIVMLLGGVTHNNNQMNGELQNVTTSNRMLILPPVIDWMLASISIRQRWWEILWWDYS